MTEEEKAARIKYWAGCVEAGTMRGGVLQRAGLLALEARGRLRCTTEQALAHVLSRDPALLSLLAAEDN